MRTRIRWTISSPGTLAHARVEVAEVRLAAPVGEEPWSGYDGQTVPDIRVVLSTAVATLVTRVLRSERGHTRCKGVVEAAETRR